MAQQNNKKPLLTTELASARRRRGTAMGIGGSIVMGLHVKDEIKKQKTEGTYRCPK